MCYRLTCDGIEIAVEHRAHDIQYRASLHAQTVDYLDWEYDPITPTITVAEYNGHRYQIEIVPAQERE